MAAADRPKDFQTLLLRLQHYWAERGCALLQGYDLEVGAGTMNPQTFLRVLGPEPWNVAYIEPSRRPADGRFGGVVAVSFCAPEGEAAAHAA